MPFTNYKNHNKIKGFSSQNQKHYPPSLPLEPIYQEIHLKFDLPNKRAQGEVKTRIHANVSGKKSLTFDAVNLEIQEITGVDEWHYTGEKIELKWAAPFNKDEERTVSVKYIIDNPITGMYFSFPDEKYPDRTEYSVTDNESERARYWLPCIDHLSVRCKVDFYLTALEKYTIVANGKLLATTTNSDGTITSHWHQEFPCPSYLLTLGVGDFITVEAESVDMGQGEIPVAYLTTSNYSKEDLKRSFIDTPKYLNWMAQKWQCTLGWDKYYQIITHHHGGAMENISLVTWSDFALLDEKEAKEMQYFVDLVNVHEMAHSWFGDMIVCKEFSHAWLKESWATYVESLYIEDNWSYDEFLYHLYQDAVNYISEAEDDYKRPIVTGLYDSSWDMYDHHLYPGGAWRLHMLRRKVGDNAFIDATRDYLNSFRGKIVETVDFRRKMEEHSSENLEEYFDQWFYAKGFPDLKAEFEFNEETQLGSVKITQNQVNEKENIDLFKFPLEIKWQYFDGASFEQKYYIENREQTCYFKIDKKPDVIILDPQYSLLCKLEFNPGLEILKNNLKSGNLITQIRAAQELAKIGSKSAIEAIKEAYQKSTFWGLKIEFIKSLKDIAHEMIPEVISDLLIVENHPMVLGDALRAIIGLRDPKIFTMAKTILLKEDQYYWASGFALKVIGGQRTSEAIEFLLSYQVKDDFKALIEGQYYWALGKTRDPRVLETLKSKLIYGNVPEKARSSVLFGLVDAITWVEKSKKGPYIEFLIDLFKYENDEKLLARLRNAFGNLKDPSLIPVLQQGKSKYALQSQPAVDRAIKKLGKTSEPGATTKKLETKVEKLEKKIGKLLHRIEVLEESAKTPKKEE